MDISLWNEAHNRLEPETWPIVRPSFSIKKNSKIFTIGSCFARNIEEHLEKLGFDIAMLSFSVPKSEWAYRNNGILNKYTPVSILQTILWTYSLYTNEGFTNNACDCYLYCDNDEQYIDLDIDGFVPVSSSRFYDRRLEIFNLFCQLFNSDCIVITLGLIETWFDIKNNIYLQRSPQKNMKADNRFIFKVLSFEECKSAVQSSIDIIRQVNPNSKFLLTTSPVPLMKTYTNMDVISANMFSKSVLRAVCGEIAKENENIDYFPSYESVTLTKSWNIWASDKRHVKDGFVGSIISKLLTSYFPDVDEAYLRYQKSFSAFKNQMFDQAQLWIEKAMEIQKNNSNFLDLYARILLSKKNLIDAQKYAEIALEISPDNSSLKLLLCKILFEKDMFSDASVLLEVLLQDNPGFEVFILYGRINLINGNYSIANDIFSQAIALNPASSEGYYWMAKSLLTLHKNDDALQISRKGLALNKYDVKLLELIQSLQNPAQEVQ